MNQHPAESATRLADCWRGAVVASLCLAALPLLKGCAVNPATGSPNLVLMSAEREKEIGREEHQKIAQSSSFYEDEALNDYITEIGNRMAEVGDRPELDYRFFIIDSPEINAFALPGGYVYINRGLLAHLNTEAELAGVLGHEIAHITARHAAQQQARGTLARIAAQAGGIATAVATGSGYIGSQISQVASVWARAGLSGFGREHELEADQLGAEYLLRAGYDPIGMIDTLSVLKNHQDFTRLTTNRAGGYHGLFATHPRSDQRLQQAIRQVRDLNPEAIFRTGNGQFRAATEGLILGESRAAKTNETRNRYYQMLLGYTMVFPDGWLVTETTTTATGSGPDMASLRVEAQRLQVNQSAGDFLAARFPGVNIEQPEPLEQFRLRGHTGIVRNPATGGWERVAAIYMGPRAYLFRGELPPGAEAEEADALLLESIRSFRPMEPSEYNLAEELRIRYVMVDENFDFAIAARNSKIKEHPEETLRLLNGYYPIGNPEPGEWVKLVE